MVDLIVDTAQGGMASANIDPTDIDAAHVGNFIGELTCYQGHLGAFFLEADPALGGIPTARHEAACASGSIAALAGMAEIEAGRYDCVAVLGVEMERNISGKETAAHLGVAAWEERECRNVQFPWPHLFSRLADTYDERFGLSRDHLVAIAQQNFANAKRNPNAQTRGWDMPPEKFGEDDEHNPRIDGRIRRQDCSQVTDGGAIVFLASQAFAERYATREAKSLDAFARILGWGHRTARIAFEDKIEDAGDDPWIFPQVRGTVLDAFARAELHGVDALHCIETHDCFTPTQYMAVDHFGLTAPGENARAIEDGTTAFEGKLPMNPSGGLMGAGHPVGATGVRMLLDCARQVTDSAGDYQVDGAKRAATLNIGGSATTSVCFVVGN